MRKISLDTEVKWLDKEYSVALCGNDRFVRDPRFECYVVSVCDGAETWSGHPRDFNWEALNGAHLGSHNAAFDMSVVDQMVRLGKIPQIFPARWSCTANMTAALCQRRSLAAAVEFLFGVHLTKTARDDSSGKSWESMEADGTLPAFLEYARHDAYWCWRLMDEYMPKWSEFEQRISEHTIKMTRRGFPIDRSRVSKSREVLEYALRACEAKMPWIEAGRPPTSPKAIAEKCREVGIPAPPVKAREGEEAYEEWEAAFAPKFDWIQAVGRWRSIGKAIDSVDNLEARISEDDVLRYDMLYFGAATGRVTGRGYNVLNMRKVPLYFDDAYNWLEPDDEGGPPPGTAHIVDQRGWMVPPKGCLLGIVDSAQIEPRIAHWFAGNHRFLDKIRAGLPLYEAFARSVGWYDQPEPLKSNKSATELYKTAKACVIGGGYGIGTEKFVATAFKLAKLKIDLAQAEDIIHNRFRPSVPEIADKETGIWARLTRDFESSVGGDYCMELPTGRKLWYRNVRRERKVQIDKKTGLPVARWKTTAEFFNEKTQQIQRESLWGGALLENLCQAFGREVFMYQTLEIEDKLGFPVLLHCYDEGVAAIPEDSAAEALEAMIVEYSKTPPFAEGLPLAAEGKVADRYLK